ncbi:hypothetical protein GALLR39Z86_32710 [Glycomyces algeriensis]|uniref:Uncharacterized protein n=1 Tax=Glycomyces algeriensis TaxID=256037 RepID=A0A9W6GAM4_9ACTN|nr:hypothetical protein GALLR39Z86_32710 [Glycomyces algeriensis]
MYWIDKNTGMHDNSNLKDETEPNQGYTDEELAGAELIACGTANHAYEVDVCPYEGDVEVGVYAVDFVFEVYEAATHEQVGEIVVKNTEEPSSEGGGQPPIPGEEPDSWGCPMYIQEGNSILREPKPDEVDAAMTAFAAAHGEA